MRRKIVSILLLSAAVASCGVLQAVFTEEPYKYSVSPVEAVHGSVETPEDYDWAPTIEVYTLYEDIDDYEEEEKAEADALTQEDAEILMKIAMAEASSDGVKGKAMVMAVVLNRVKNESFPDTIEEVVFQSGQFSPVRNGSFYSAKPDYECHMALAEIEEGNYDDVTALFFDSCTNSWASRNREYLYTIGHHKFYK